MLSLTLAAVNAPYWPSGDSPFHLSKFTKRTRIQVTPAWLGVEAVVCQPPPPRPNTPTASRSLRASDWQPSLLAWLLSTVCVDLQDVGVAEPRFLFLLTSCSSPACAPTWKNYQQQQTSLCVLLFQKKEKKQNKKYFGTFYFESHSIFVMRKI